LPGKTTENSGLKFKAAILVEQNRPLIVDEIGRHNRGLGCGQVLVKVHCSSICGAQIGEITGAGGEDKYIPHLLGHEGGGVVEEIGIDVTTVKKGDHVVLHWRKGVGIEAKPPKYKWGDGEVGGGLITTFNEYAVVSENRLTRIGEDIDFEIAALMGCAVTTGLGIINNEAKLKIGQSIAVIGCGGVGLNVIQGAEMVSANPIIAIDIHDEKLDMAVDFGATDTFNMKRDSLSHLRADVVVECTGLVGMIETAYFMTVPRGRLILVGQPHYEQILILHGVRQHYCGKTVMDSEGGQTSPSVDIPRYLKLYRAGKLKLDTLITDRYPLTEINKAIEMVKLGKCGKVILEM